MMPKTKEQSRSIRTTLRLPDLDQSKNSVRQSLGSAASKRTYGAAIEDFISWYCSEPRLAFGRTVVLRYLLLRDRGRSTRSSESFLRSLAAGRIPTSTCRSKFTILLRSMLLPSCHTQLLLFQFVASQFASHHHLPPNRCLQRLYERDGRTRGWPQRGVRLLRYRED
jgi:hypothetical protein